MIKNILYSTGCPACRTLKHLLEKNNIDYKEETDIEILSTLGFKTVPIFYTGDRYLNFNETIKWIKENKNEE